MLLATAPPPSFWDDALRLSTLIVSAATAGLSLISAAVWSRRPRRRKLRPRPGRDEPDRAEKEGPFDSGGKTLLELLQAGLARVVGHRSGED